MAQARIALGPKALLDSQSKLICISQKVAASTAESDLNNRLKFAIEFLYVKLIQGRCLSSVRDLQRIEMPMIIKAYTLLNHLQNAFQYEQSDLKALLQYVSTPLKWYEAFVATGDGQGTAARVLEPLPNQGLAATWAACS